MIYTVPTQTSRSEKSANQNSIKLLKNQIVTGTYNVAGSTAGASIGQDAEYSCSDCGRLCRRYHRQPKRTMFGFGLQRSFGRSTGIISVLSDAK